MRNNTQTHPAEQEVVLLLDTALEGILLIALFVNTASGYHFHNYLLLPLGPGTAAVL